MKVSVSLPQSDIDFVDHYAREHRATRSAVLQEAVEMLRRRDLSADYEAANDEWAAGGEADLWNTATGDGLR